MRLGLAGSYPSVQSNNDKDLSNYGSYETNSHKGFVQTEKYLNWRRFRSWENAYWFMSPS